MSTYSSSNYCSPFPERYRSVYTGDITYTENGDFRHFTMALQNIHIERGYWKFVSPKDDCWAYSQGFRTPEDILIAQDRTDAVFRNINIQWVWGRDSPEMTLPVSGSPIQQLETIYEVRQIVGMPMSLRGQYPTYPPVEDKGVKRFWADKMISHLLVPVKRPTAQNIEPQIVYTELCTPAVSFDDDDEPATCVESDESSVTDSDGLPCMDCGISDTHEWDCNIGSMFRPQKKLTMLDHHRLADTVERSLSGTWTTHWHPPFPPSLFSETPEERMQGIAAVIRRAESYKERSELHRLPDDLVVMFCGFKAPGENE